MLTNKIIAQSHCFVNRQIVNFFAILYSDTDLSALKRATIPIALKAFYSYYLGAFSGTSVFVGLSPVKKSP